jgi:hydrogenase nickel incorporation protein HypA/HybF
MHELSITQNILDISVNHAREAGAKRVTDIYLVIGQWSSIVDESVQFYWSIIAKDTLAEHARLHFRRIPAEMFCLECNHRYTPSNEELACPRCNSIRVKIIAGEEFYLEAIDIEK